MGKEAQDIYAQLQGLQASFQNSGVENLLKVGEVTGENSQYGLFGGGDNFKAKLPGGTDTWQKLAPFLGALTLGRLRAVCGTANLWRLSPT